MARKMPEQVPWKASDSDLSTFCAVTETPLVHYVGRTADVGERLRWHNDGPSGQTIRHRPWRVLVAIEFPDGGAAARFERYLKAGSGRVFANRHFGDVRRSPGSAGSNPEHPAKLFRTEVTRLVPAIHRRFCGSNPSQSLHRGREMLRPHATATGDTDGRPIRCSNLSLRPLPVA